MSQTIWYTLTIVMADVETPWTGVDAQTELEAFFLNPFVAALVGFLVVVLLVEMVARMLKGIALS